MDDNKYLREITASASGGQTIKVDVYDVLKAFATGCPAIDHAVKKLLCAGMRGHKDRRQDLQEAMTSIRRAIELMSGGEFRAELPQADASEDKFKVGDKVKVVGFNDTHSPNQIYHVESIAFDKASVYRFVDGPSYCIDVHNLIKVED